MELKRRADETAFQHHARLVRGKLVDKSLADVDYSELSEHVYGQLYTSDAARRMFYGSARTIDMFEKSLEEEARNASAGDVIDQQKIDLQKERQRLFDQRNALNKLIRERSRQEELNDIISAAVMSKTLPSLEYEPCGDYVRSDNDILVSLNDIHYGASVDNYWCQYNSDVCREMMRGYLDRIIQIGKTHGSENCVVWANGDEINGNIHHTLAVTNKENVIQQIVGVSELISEFLAALSEHFVTVRFVSVAGNHSRIDLKERALKDERLDDLIEWYMQARLQNFRNIVFNDCEKIDETIYIINIRGKNYLGIHGDLDEGPAKIQSVVSMSEKKIYAVLAGHKHHNKTDFVQGIKTIMAGSFIGMDDFCVQKRIYGKPQQVVCVCDTGGVLCSYDIDLQ